MHIFIHPIAHCRTKKEKEMLSAPSGHTPYFFSTTNPIAMVLMMAAFILLTDRFHEAGGGGPYDGASAAYFGRRNGKFLVASGCFMGMPARPRPPPPPIPSASVSVSAGGL